MFQRKCFKERRRRFSKKCLPELIDAGLTALECRHSSHAEGAERYAYELSERYGLMPVGGSDFHGFYSEWPIALGSVGMEDCNLLHPIW